MAIMQQSRFIVLFTHHAYSTLVHVFAVRRNTYSQTPHSNFTCSTEEAAMPDYKTRVLGYRGPTNYSLGNSDEIRLEQTDYTHCL